MLFVAMTSSMKVASAHSYFRLGPSQRFCGNQVIYLIQSSNSSESESRLWARAEELKDRDGGNQFSARCSLQIDDRVSSLVNDHLGFVSETEIKKSEISRPTVVERSKASVFRLRSWMMRSRVRNPVSTSQTSSFGSGTAREKSSSSSRKNEKPFV